MIVNKHWTGTACQVQAVQVALEFNFQNEINSTNFEHLLASYHAIFFEELIFKAGVKSAKTAKFIVLKNFLLYGTKICVVES